MCNDVTMSDSHPEAPELPEPSPPEPTPTWMRDLRRVAFISLFGVLFVTALIWFASTGLMLNKTWSDTIDADATWAGICAGLLVFLFPFLFYEKDRRDNGFRHSGLVPLVIVGVISGAVIITLVMMTWPFFLGERAVPGTVAAELGGDPASVLLVLLFTIGGMAWCLSIVMTMILGGFKWAMLMLAPYLGSIFIFSFAGVKVFENPPGLGSIVIWVAVALSGLAVLTVLAMLRNVIDKSTPQMSAAEREAAYQRYLTDRRRRGLTDESPLPGIDGPQPPQGNQPGPHPGHPPGPPVQQRPLYPPQRPPQGPRR